VGVRDKVRRVRVNRMYFIRLYILGDSKESNTSDPTFEKRPCKGLNSQPPLTPLLKKCLTKH
jgi:hypothetical protein